MNNGRPQKQSNSVNLNYKDATSCMKGTSISLIMWTKENKNYCTASQLENLSDDHILQAEHAHNIKLKRFVTIPITHFTSEETPK